MRGYLGRLIVADLQHDPTAAGNVGEPQAAMRR